MTNAERQAAFRARMREQGLESCTVWVPAELACEIRALAEALCANRDLTPGPVRNVRTGKLGKAAGIR